MCLYSWDYTINHIQNKNGKRSHTYDINRRRSAHGHKYSEYKGCLNMMMPICIKQHLTNSRSSILEKVKQHWGWVEKKVLFNKKKCVIKIYLKQSCRPFAFTSYSFSKKGNELFSRPHCLHDFWRKIYLL